VDQGGGVDGSDRVVIVWPDNAVKNQWLQVTVAATANTGLAEPDVFYFGNAPAEAGGNATNTIVNATDEIVARRFQHSAVNPASIDDPYDYNRDGLVNATDQMIARSNQTNPLTMLRLITAPQGSKAAGPTIVMDSPASDSVLSAELDWHYELNAEKTPSQTRKQETQTAVDTLLATFWT